MDKVLLVDDDPINISILVEIFEEGYQYETASSGTEALSKVNSFQPDLILLDIMMPGMDGFEVCRRIKADAATSSIPIIFLTALTKLDEKIRGFEVGGEDYITKPFEAEEVLARTRTHLKLRHAQQTIRRHSEELEERLDERTRELIATEKQAAFSLIIQGIIHNLRGPLTAVMGLSDIIAMTAGKQAENCEQATADPATVCQTLYNIKSNAHLITQAADELQKMIDSLMDKSRSDKTDECEVCDLNALIRRELEFLNGDMRFKHAIKKTISLSEAPLKIFVIPSEIAQVLSNLVRNAIDAMCRQEHAKMAIATDRRAAYALLTVSDNGPGIPEKLRQKVFEPFFTTKARATQPHEVNEPVGTGLGLYTVSNIVASYDGHITIRASEAGGAEITIEIPLIEEE
jgi:signal transduction histidine kinase